ncbi:MAG TPA: type 1 glutamine amidotransferase domain-containing protein [Aestuariivirgaceae bacterium]|jgi:protease I
MNTVIHRAPSVDAGVRRVQDFESPAAVPLLSTQLLVTAEGELNQELNSFLFDPPTNPELLKGKQIAICCTNGVEEVEIVGSYRWLTEHGATVHIVSPKAGQLPASYGVKMPPIAETHVLAIRLMENAGWLKIDRHLETAEAGDYDAVIVPGGCWNPDFLRADRNAHRFLQAMHAAGKPVCGICHGPWVLINAGLLKGRRATAVWNIHIDLQNAGAEVSDEPVVVDGNLITARFPYDLPRMVKALVAQLVA